MEKVSAEYPKCTPSEMMGLLVLLKDHTGSDDLARLADDLDLEIDEILPAVEFAEALGFLQVADGKGSLTEAGRKLLSGTIRTRKATLREALKNIKPFKRVVGSLEATPSKTLTGDQLGTLLSPVPVPSEETLHSLISWGRYTELFHYDAEDNLLKLVRQRSRTTTNPLPQGV